jgi:hypothetical protein
VHKDQERMTWLWKIVNAVFGWLYKLVTRREYGDD